MSSHQDTGVEAACLIRDVYRLCEIISLQKVLGPAGLKCKKTPSGDSLSYYLKNVAEMEIVFKVKSHWNKEKKNLNQILKESRAEGNVELK